MTDTAESLSTHGEGLQYLSAVAASAQPIDVACPQPEPSSTPGSVTGTGSFNGVGSGITTSISKPHPPYKHRRMSSSGQARRRMSDAREANSRPSAATIQTAAAALSSLATLSLSSSPPVRGLADPAASFTSASDILASKPIATNGISPKPESSDEEMTLGEEFDTPVKLEINVGGITMTSTKGNGKKRGTIFKCESCSKVYRHPSCLIKHRWEHSPHWREASKLMLSKHQQVQLLEAAAILSHIGPSAAGGTSLPEDRSLWPSYMSGGLLPPPNADKTAPVPSASFEEYHTPFHTSSSVPALSVLSSRRSSSRASSTGPRMHDYSIPGAGGITHVRPGVVGVPTRSDAQNVSTDNPSEEGPTGTRSIPVPVPKVDPSAYREHDVGSYSFVSGPSDSWGSPVSIGFAQSSFRSSSLSTSAIEPSLSYSEGTGGWSLPRSSLRSSSRSRSGSFESDFVDVEGDVMAGRQYGFSSRTIGHHDAAAQLTGVGKEKIEEEWDGMEMEMEM